jgi:predicted metal-dependent enzyme (double-stranded beta helix superfamily)
LLAFRAAVLEALQFNDEPRLFAHLQPALQALLTTPDWLPATHARSDAQRYQQHPLFIDAFGRFSIVSFVWGPGQSTPVHDHTVWGLVGVLQGAEMCQHFVPGPEGWEASEEPHRLEAGSVDCVSPSIGDVHKVSNALADGTTISIHVYGADIGRTERHIMRPGTREVERFVSGYSDQPVWIIDEGLPG